MHLSLVCNSWAILSTPVTQSGCCCFANSTTLLCIGIERPITMRLRMFRFQLTQHSPYKKAHCLWCRLTRVFSTWTHRRIRILKFLTPFTPMSENNKGCTMAMGRSLLWFKTQSSNGESLLGPCAICIFGSKMYLQSVTMLYGKYKNLTSWKRRFWNRMFPLGLLSIKDKITISLSQTSPTKFSSTIAPLS